MIIDEINNYQLSSVLYHLSYVASGIATINFRCAVPAAKALDACVIASASAHRRGHSLVLSVILFSIYRTIPTTDCHADAGGIYTPTEQHDSRLAYRPLVPRGDNL
jgi:hypothetical protein